MVAQYTLFGRQVGSHVLAMAVLGITGLGSYVAVRGDGKPKKEAAPTNASSKEEDDFIQEFIRNANAEEQKGKH